MNIKQGFNQLKQDITIWYKGIFAALCYVLVANWLFGTICTSVLITGIPCPACGLTRAGVSILTFHWNEAWNYNCIIFLIVPFVLYLFTCRYIFQCKCKLLVPGIVLIFLCLIVVYMYRMIYYFPNIEPMVYNDANLYQYIKNFITNMY